jgi:hypothetical protein
LKALLNALYWRIRLDALHALLPTVERLSARQFFHRVHRMQNEKEITEKKKKKKKKKKGREQNVV